MYSLEELGLLAHELSMEVKGDNILMEVVLEEFIDVVYAVLNGNIPSRDEDIIQTVKELLEDCQIDTWTHGEFYLILNKYLEIMEVH